MPDIQTINYPGSTATITPAGPGPGGPSDLENFYRELLRRQTVAAQTPAPMAAAIPQGYGYSNGPRRPDLTEGYRPEQTQLDREREQDARQEMAYRQRLREIDLNPPKKFIDSRPGINGGWLQDTTLLPVSMRPGSAQIVSGPQDAARAQGRFADDQAFNAQVDAQRARTQTTNNAYYGR